MRSGVNKVRDWIQSLLAKFGYRLRLESLNNVYPEDVRKGSNDPRALSYHSVAQPVLIEAPLYRGYGLDWFRLTPWSAHPFICAIRRAKSTDTPDLALQATLSTYYSEVCPRSASEILDLSPGVAPELDKNPPWARVFPWDSASVSKRRQTIKEAAKIDTKEYGKSLDIDHGWKAIGPASKQLINVEYRRLKRLWISMQNDGYKRNNEPGGDIRATVLMSDERPWTWHVDWGGQHRAAVAAALGIETVPVRIWRVVRLSDIDIWPNVERGLFSENHARRLFRLITSEDEFPRIIEDWVQKSQDRPQHTTD